MHWKVLMFTLRNIFIVFWEVSVTYNTITAQKNAIEKDFIIPISTRLKW